MPPNIADLPEAGGHSSENEEDLSKAVPTGLRERGHVNPELEPHPNPDSEAPSPLPIRSEENEEESFALTTFMSTLNTLAHAFIGVVVTFAVVYALIFTKPLTATPIHIILCVIGYQLLMAEAILCLSSSNGWSSRLRLVDKRRIHWILQIGGAGLAIAGSFVKILDKTTHWTTPHGKAALVALVFTSVSLVNGLASLWAYELRRWIPGNLSKITHICFGTVGFAASCITLCYGFEKTVFKNWIHEDLSYYLIAATSALCFLVIIIPLFNFYTKSRSVIRR